jgi:hypothetical protein
VNTFALLLPVAALAFALVLSEPAQEAEAPRPVVVNLPLVRPKGPDTVSHINEKDVGRSCELHGFVFEKDKVPISYGLLGVGDPEAARAQFPNSNSWVPGGCFISDDSPKYAEVLYCRACRAAEERWRREQGPREPGE